MILSGPEIRKQVAAGKIRLDPFNDEQVNPSSYDLRLGDEYICYQTRGIEIMPKEIPPSDPKKVRRIPFFDCKDPASIERGSYRGKIPESGLTLEPGQLYLMHTLECAGSDLFMPSVEGKSSIGRLGVCVHVTAGVGEAGFKDQWTLEVAAMYPTVVYAGMRFAQILFYTIAGEIELYKGNYTGEYAVGPQMSRIWRQFEKK